MYSCVTISYRWLPRAAIRSVEGDPSDCVLVVGVSRPKMALAILAVMLLSLFLTFHLIYDSAINSIHAAHTDRPRPPLLLISKRLYPAAARRLPQVLYWNILQSMSSKTYKYRNITFTNLTLCIIGKGNDSYYPVRNYISVIQGQSQWLITCIWILLEFYFYLIKMLLDRFILENDVPTYQSR